MKILTLLGIALLVGSTGCGPMSPANRVKGSGTVKTEKRPLAPFNSLEVNCYGTIQVRAQGPEELEISGDDNIIPLITTEVKNGILYIGASKEYDPQSKLQIIVSTPNLEKLVFAGAGQANLSNVKNDRVELVMSGAGRLIASGETKEADVTLSGAGAIDAKNLHAEIAKVNSTGAGSVDVYATDQLDANASGVGSINYYGSPKVVNKQAGGIGRINQK